MGTKPVGEGTGHRVARILQVANNPIALQGTHIHPQGLELVAASISEANARE
ncbi:hypothetical protein [Citrobacter freundii]|uniref:hypothetical protein n=1 Tax=Citrobacter freundii TaxID=546 RepID=UPI0029847A05|nr:hypothetical protein [Citrobacter freundii]